MRNPITNGNDFGQYGAALSIGLEAIYAFGYKSMRDSASSPSVDSYTVHTGDTLQSIAAAVYGDSSQWTRIAETNGLRSNNDLRVGQTISTPSTNGTLTTGSAQNPNAIVARMLSINLPTPMFHGWRGQPKVPKRGFGGGGSPGVDSVMSGLMSQMAWSNAFDFSMSYDEVNGMDLASDQVAPAPPPAMPVSINLSLPHSNDTNINSIGDLSGGRNDSMNVPGAFGSVNMSDGTSRSFEADNLSTATLAAVTPQDVANITSGWNDPLGDFIAQNQAAWDARSAEADREANRFAMGVRENGNQAPAYVSGQDKTTALDQLISSKLFFDGNPDDVYYAYQADKKSHLELPWDTGSDLNQKKIRDRTAYINTINTTNQYIRSEIRSFQEDGATSSLIASQWDGGFTGGDDVVNRALAWINSQDGGIDPSQRVELAQPDIEPLTPEAVAADIASIPSVGINVSAPTLTHEEQRQAQTDAALIAGKYNPISSMGQAIANGNLGDFWYYFAQYEPQSPAAQAARLAGIQRIVGTESPEIQRLDAMEASPIGTAFSLITGGLGGSQQAQDLALATGGVLESFGGGLVGINQSGAKVGKTSWARIRTRSPGSNPRVGNIGSAAEAAAANATADAPISLRPVNPGTRFYVSADGQVLDTDVCAQLRLPNRRA